jgi:hypothetical protein
MISPFVCPSVRPSVGILVVGLLLVRTPSCATVDLVQFVRSQIAHLLAPIGCGLSLLANVAKMP